eukprot:m.82335 g.82335  ORF g.82335 m.82335 type:complete len:393 (-) comp8119_c0_seq4:272-1450(-)
MDACEHPPAARQHTDDGLVCTTCGYAFNELQLDDRDRGQLSLGQRYEKRADFTKAQEAASKNIAAICGTVQIGESERAQAEAFFRQVIESPKLEWPSKDYAALSASCITIACRTSQTAEFVALAAIAHAAECKEVDVVHGIAEVRRVLNIELKHVDLYQLLDAFFHSFQCACNADLQPVHLKATRLIGFLASAACPLLFSSRRSVAGAAFRVCLLHAHSLQSHRKGKHRPKPVAAFDAHMESVYCLAPSTLLKVQQELTLAVEALARAVLPGRIDAVRDLDRILQNEGIILQCAPSRQASVEDGLAPHAAPMTTDMLLARVQRAHSINADDLTEAEAAQYLRTDAEVALVRETRAIITTAPPTPGSHKRKAAQPHAPRPKYDAAALAALQAD